MTSEPMRSIVPRLLAVAFNVIVVLPWACLIGVFGPVADVGVNEQKRALLVGSFLVGVGSLNLIALLLPAYGSLFEVARWVALAANGLVVAMSVLMLRNDNLYPFHGELKSLLPLIGVATFTALALLLRRRIGLADKGVFEDIP